MNWAGTAEVCAQYHGLQHLYEYGLASPCCHHLSTGSVPVLSLLGACTLAGQLLLESGPGLLQQGFPPVGEEIPAANLSYRCLTPPCSCMVLTVQTSRTKPSLKRDSAFSAARSHTNIPRGSHELFIASWAGRQKRETRERVTDPYPSAQGACKQQAEPLPLEEVLQGSVWSTSGFASALLSPAVIQQTQ